MRRAGFGLLIVIALAGCSAPWGDETDRLALRDAERLSGACALPFLNISPVQPALGETIVIEAAIVNCGGVPLEFMEPGRCAGSSALRVELQHEAIGYTLDDPNPSALPTSPGTHFASCGPMRLAPLDTIAPGASIRARWEWNGSLARTYSWVTALGDPWQGTSISTTREIIPPRPGGYHVSLTFAHAESRLSWTREADLYIMGEEELPVHRRATQWRMDPSAVAKGTMPLPGEPPGIVRLAANASLESRGWHDPRREHLGIEAAGDHYLVRERLDLGLAGLTFDVAIPVTADGKPLARPVEGLPDRRELADECEVRVSARFAESSTANGGVARLVWHRIGERGTFAWDVGGVLVDAQDGQRLPRA